MSETKAINLSKTALGIELGSTRIKAVLIDHNHTPLVSGEHEWENQLNDGIWTYSKEDVWAVLQAAYRELAEKFEIKHKVKLNTVGSIGFSAMMHGYLPLIKKEINLFLLEHGEIRLQKNLLKIIRIISI